MDKKVILWIILGLLVVVILWQTLQISAIGKAVAGSVSSGNVAPLSGGMVGGC